MTYTAFDTVTQELADEATRIRLFEPERYWQIRRVLVELAILRPKPHALVSNGDGHRGKLVSERLKLRRTE